MTAASPTWEVELRTVTAPDGSEHTVRIEWVGNKLRRAPAQLRARMGRMSELADAPDVGFVDDLGGIVGAIVAVVVLALVVIFVLPLAWGLLELLLVVVLAALVWAFRVLFRRPWHVVHRGPGDADSASWRVVGWREAHRVVVEAAGSIERSGAAQVTPPAAGWAGGGAPGVS